MIRLLVLDVDGTTTDGGVYYDATGNELKKFAIKDGAGLVLARTAGIRVMICTGRECEAVRRRAADLKITDIYQNVPHKADFLQKFFAENGYAREEIAYCGDGVTQEGVRRMLGMSGGETLTGILRALAAGDGAGMLAVADAMQTQGLSFAQALRDLAGLLHRVALVHRVLQAVSDDDPHCASIR